MRTLHIGDPEDSHSAFMQLTVLHGKQPITRILFAQGSPFGACFAHGTHPLHGVQREVWPGHWDIKCDNRPPCAGIDLLRTVLIDALPLAPKVIIWGPMPAFWARRQGEAGRRVRGWDVPVEIVEREALQLGYDGWRWVGNALVPLCKAAMSPPITAALLEARQVGVASDVRRP